MTYRLEIEIAGLPDLQSLRYAHWRTRHRHDREWKYLVDGHAQAKGLPPEPLESAHLELVRYSTREPDTENLANSFKALVDALKGTVIVDDSPRHVSREYRWERVGPREGRVRLIVTEGMWSRDQGSPGARSDQEPPSGASLSGTEAPGPPEDTSSTTNCGADAGSCTASTKKRRRCVRRAAPADGQKAERVKCPRTGKRKKGSTPTRGK